MRGVGSAQAGVIQAHDETGQRWFVYADDPGWPAVRALYLRGVREIVLPRVTFIKGAVAPVKAPRTMNDWDVTNPTFATLLRRYVRLQDCVEALNAAVLG